MMRRGAPVTRPVPRRWRNGLVRSTLLLLLVLLSPARSAPVSTEPLEFHAPAQATDPRTPKVMRDLADRIIPVYQDTDRPRYLANLSALQMVAGSDAAAYAARLSLDEVRRRRGVPPALDAVAYDLHARARALQAEEATPYAKGFAQSFEAAVEPLDDLAAYRLIRWLKTPPAVFQAALQKQLDRYRGQDRISMSDALTLIWTYLAFDAHRSFAPLIKPLAAADDQRRYVIDDSIEVKTAKGASVSALLVRPKSRPGRLPTLLSFTAAPSSGNDATECAAHGYAAVVAHERGKNGSFVPFEHEGADARAVIDWIAAQGWSDGKVGMYGSGYSAFVAWAAAKHPPPALKAILSVSAMAPGINTPMEGNIFRNEAYRWLIAVSGSAADQDAGHEDAHWSTLDERYYGSGWSYQKLDRLAGVPSPTWHHWLNHPSYDRYWESRVPGPKELARLDIPVLTLTGYYDPGEEGALYYFTRYHRYNPHADDILLAGPYDARALLTGPAATLGGYTLDPAALVDLDELRFQWLDHVLRGAPRPALLAGRVNYEVMGANAWRHRASLREAGTLTLYLTPTGEEGGLLQPKPGKAGAFVKQSIDLAARSPIPPPPSPALLTDSLPIRNSVVFVSDPLPQALELAGRPTLQLELLTDKWDLDLTIGLYEKLAGGQYLRLYSPAYEQRASYARNRRLRQVLKRGVLQRLTLRGARLLARRVEAGSRLVLVLGVKKRPDEEIDYGSGKDVSQESIADGRHPLTIRWYGSSSLDIPVWR